jgi:hypothetical protein
MCVQTEVEADGLTKPSGLPEWHWYSATLAPQDTSHDYVIACLNKYLSRTVIQREVTNDCPYLRALFPVRLCKRGPCTHGKFINNLDEIVRSRNQLTFKCRKIREPNYRHTSFYRTSQLFRFFFFAENWRFVAALRPASLSAPFFQQHVLTSPLCVTFW